MYLAVTKLFVGMAGMMLADFVWRLACYWFGDAKMWFVMSIVILIGLCYALGSMLLGICGVPKKKS